MKNKNKTLMIVGIIIVVLFLFSSGNLNLPKFAIADSDYTCDSPYNITLPNQNINISNVTIYMNDSNTTRAFISGRDYWAVDNETSSQYSAFPDITGTHKIYKVSYTIKNNDTIEHKLCYLMYTKEINISYVTANVTSQQICLAVNGTYSNTTCTCPNGNRWSDNSTSKVCGPITKTVEKEVQLQPSFFDKYGIAMIILVIAGVAIFVILNWGKKKR